jgi:hypothetical protein
MDIDLGTIFWIVFWIVAVLILIRFYSDESL